MVRAVRRGASLRAVARQFHVSPTTVQRWLARARGQRLDRIDLRDYSSAPYRVANRMSLALEDLVLQLRRELRDQSDLGEFGAAAIRRELLTRGLAEPPSLRTIGRILERRGALDARHRVRRPAPPLGWYLPEVSARRAELDEFDVVEGLLIKGGPEVMVLTGVSLHGGLSAAWPRTSITAAVTREALVEHWRAVGLPAYAQFDNDTRFQGPHQYPETIGTVIRLCLSLGVVPVFAVPHEMGLQAAIESLNGRWQAKVWARFHHPSLEALQAQSAKYMLASRQRAAARIEAAPPRRPFPVQWRFKLTAPVKGRIIYLRRTTAQGGVTLLGHTFVVEPLWSHRLVRCEVDIDAAVLRFYALRRREPDWQPLLREVPYRLSQRYYS
jgi:transposase-like protein